MWHYLRRDMRDVEDERKKLYPRHWEKHQLLCAPLITRLSRELATLYVQTPGREFESLSDAQAERAAKIYEAADVNAIMREAQQTLVALNQAVIWCLPVPEVGGVRLVLVPPHEQTVIMGDPTSHNERDVAEWYLRMPVSQSSITGSLTWATAKITPTEAIYTDGPKEVRGKGVWAQDGSNPLGFIPAVRLKGSIPALGEFWCPVPEDLLAAVRSLTMNLSDMALLARMQGHGQAVVKGLPISAAREIELGPETCVGLSEPEYDFEYVQADPRLAEYKTITQYYLDTIVALNGLSPSSVLKSSAITALAKRLEMLDRDVERRRHMHEFSRAEAKLYKAVSGWVNWQRNAEVLPPTRVEMTYREPALVVDALHEQQAVDLRIASGISSVSRELARTKGISLEEAKKQIADNRAEPGGMSQAQVVAALAVTDAISRGSVTPDGALALLVDGLGMSEDSASRLVAGTSVAEG